MITLKNLAKASEQEVFNQVATHLITQGKRSIETTLGQNSCVYKSKDGLMCAAGCLIGPKEYKKKFEGYIWDGLAFEGFVPEEHWLLIRMLQCVHDREQPHNWKRELTRVALARNLEIPEILKGE